MEDLNGIGHVAKAAKKNALFQSYDGHFTFGRVGAKRDGTFVVCTNSHVCDWFQFEYSSAKFVIVVFSTKLSWKVL